MPSLFIIFSLSYQIKVVKMNMGVHHIPLSKWKVFMFLWLATSGVTDAHPLLDIGDSENAQDSSEPKYDFSWSVSHEIEDEDVEETSVEFRHEESRSGENTKGSYYVELPGNYIMVVEYVVDGDSGYVANVRIKYGSSEEFDE